MYDEPLSRIFEAYEFKTNYWPESDEFTTALKAVAGFRGGQDQKDIEIFLHKRKAAANAGPVDLAWKDLQLEQKDSTSDDEFILALYRRIDADPKAERRLRTSLLTIADSLGNQRLRQVAKHRK